MVTTTVLAAVWMLLKTSQASIYTPKFPMSDAMSPSSPLVNLTLGCLDELNDPKSFGLGLHYHSFPRYVNRVLYGSLR
jgi:hypothetical protein